MAKKKHKTALFEISGYNSVFVCRAESSGGGLAVFVRKEHRTQIRTVQNIPDFHHIHLEITNMSRLLNLHAFYRPPSQSHEPFLKKLEDIISSCPPSNDCIIVGDINIPVNKPDVPMVKHYQSLITSYNYAITNEHSTRSASGSILDHSLCSNSLLQRIHNDTVFHDVSDHNFVITTISCTFKSFRTKLEKKKL